MRTLVFETLMPCSPQELWDFHSSATALEILTPPNKKIRISGDDLSVRDGAVHKLNFKVFGFWIKWSALISEVEEPFRFTDTATQSPFRYWSHCHEFLPHPEGALLRDTLRYEIGWGFVGRFIDRCLVGRDIQESFKFRHERTRLSVIHKK